MIYKQTMLAAGKHPIRHLAFRQKLITQLIGGFSNRKRAGRRGAEAPVIEESQFPGHTHIKAAKRVCKNCSQLGIKLQAEVGCKHLSNANSVMSTCAKEVALLLTMADTWTDN